MPPRRRRSRYRKSAFKGEIRLACKAFLIRPAQGKCQICGYYKYIGNLSFHHKDPTAKLFNISTMILTYSLPRLVREASKCILACHNCHGEIHGGLISAATIDAIPNLDYTKYRLPTDAIKWYAKQRKKK